jgi:pimeloyl-ACP methyl ester carboxylesterase
MTSPLIRCASSMRLGIEKAHLMGMSLGGNLAQCIAVRSPEPIVVSELGALGGSARTLSLVTTISYGGGLVGPPLIGAVATTAGLPSALLIPAALALGVAIAAPVVLGAVTGHRPTATTTGGSR